MANGRLAVVLHHLRTWVGGHVRTGLTDAQLLHDFLQQQEEAAFAALVQRHGPMVYGICRRMLSREQDAEDAFQATFMVLARRAGSIRKRQSLAGWLYGVARRVALKARLRAARQRDAERRGMDQANGANGTDALEQAARSEAGAVLDEELQHLPEKYRLPLILCYFEGRTYEEAADELGLPSGSMGKRLHQAQDRLRQRLLRRGVAFSASGVAGLLAATAQAAPAALQVAAVRASLLFAAGKLSAAAVPAVALAESALHALWLSKIKQGAVAALIMAALLGGGGAALVFGPGTTAPRTASSSDADTATLASIRSWREGWSKTWKGEMVHSLALDREGKIAALGRLDGTVLLLDAATGKEIGTLGKKNEVPNGPAPPPVPVFQGFPGVGGGAGFGPPGMGAAGDSINCVAFSPDGKTLAAAGASGTIRLWDVANRREQKQIVAEKELLLGIQSLMFAPDGKSLVACGNASNAFAPLGWLKQWHIETAKVLTDHLVENAFGIANVTFSADGRSVAFTEMREGVAFGGVAFGPVASNVVNLLDLESKKVIWESKNDLPEAPEIISNNGGKLLAFCCRDGSIYTWNPTKREFQPRFKLAEPSKLVGRPTISPDGRFIAAVCADSPANSNPVGAPASPDTDNQQPALAAPGVGGAQFGVGFGGAGPGFATSNQVRFFDGFTGKLVHAVPCRQGFSPSILTFSGNSQALAIGGMVFNQTEDADPVNPFGALMGEVRLLNLKSQSGTALSSLKLRSGNAEAGQKPPTLSVQVLPSLGHVESTLCHPNRSALSALNFRREKQIS
jgi:RNA polymerase sigma factor (sigma-70 family)